MKQLLSKSRTKIVATLGPASSSLDVIQQLVQSGVNVARLNMAHGSHTEHARRLKMFRACGRTTGAGVLMDLPGPKLRVSKIPSERFELKRNDEVFLSSKSLPGKNVITISYKNLLRDVQKNEAVYISDGLIRLRVDGRRGDTIRCVCTHGGLVRVGNGVNMPNSFLTMDAFTPVDAHHLGFGLRQSIDFVGLSFVGCARDVERVRRFCRERGSNPFLIAKIERTLALQNLNDIIEASDGVMVARGDLGIEEPYYKIPVIQARVVDTARSLGKPVIVATQVLESMTQNPRPTRAEATDVANAISQGADAIMLSGESAVGKYPVESVKALSEIIRETESSAAPPSLLTPVPNMTPKQVIAQEAGWIAQKIGAKFILVQSQTGRSAQRISRYRPRVPILALVDSESIRRRVSLLWGVQSLLKSIKTSMYENATLFSWLSRQYTIQENDRAVYVDTPVDSGKIVLSVIERYSPR